MQVEQKMVLKRDIEVANKQTETVEKEVKLELKFEGLKKTKLYDNFLILKNSSLEAILGTRFLCKFNCIVDFKTPRLVIDEK